MNYPARNKVIFAYPLVEYIPLYPHTLIHHSDPGVTARFPGPAVLVAGDAAAWQTIGERLGLLTTQALDFRQEIGIVTLHCPVGEVKYRDRRVTLVGEPASALVHAFGLNRKLFYHRNLEFILFRPDGARLAQARMRV